MVFESSPSDHEIWPIRCHVGVLWTLHPSRIHILRWSLKHIVKRASTGNSAFSTNESAWSVMVMVSQSRVWSGPKLALTLSTPIMHQCVCMCVFYYLELRSAKIIHLECNILPSKVKYVLWCLMNKLLDSSSLRLNSRVRHYCSAYFRIVRHTKLG